MTVEPEPPACADVTAPTCPEPPAEGADPASDPAAVPPPRRQPKDWEAIRRAYERTGLDVKAICRGFGIAASTLYDHARRERWAPRHGDGPPPPPLAEVDRRALVRRLFRAAEAQIAEIERRFSGTDAPVPDEKDARTLSALARTLELLIGLETAAGADETEPETAIDDFRLDLARRIEGLARQG